MTYEVGDSQVEEYKVTDHQSESSETSADLDNEMLQIIEEQIEREVRQRSMALHRAVEHAERVQSREALEACRTARAAFEELRTSPLAFKASMRACVEEEFRSRMRKKLEDKQLQASTRRAKHTSHAADDKQLQAQLKRLGANSIPGIE